MNELTPLLKQLLSATGLSGYEEPVRKMIEDAWKPLTDELLVSRLGSLHGLKRGNLPCARTPRPRLLVAAHIDAIGLMVTQVVDGFLRVTEIGGLDPRILPGQLVTVHGRKDLPGVIVQPPAELLPAMSTDNTVPLEQLLVDTGLPPGQVARLVRPGDLVSFAQQPIEMGKDIIAGHTLDDRAAVVALTQCLDLLRTRQHAWDVWAVATVQEEETFAGAYTSAFDLRPDIAIAIDVTHAKAPSISDYRTFPLGKGITLGWGPNVHPALHERVKKLADNLEIPYHLEPLPRHSGTDAWAMQITAEGIPCMVISIPLRYMHTPVEMVSLKDISRCGRLLAEIVTDLEADYVVEYAER